MNEQKIKLLKEELILLHKAADILEYSYKSTKDISEKKEYTFEELDKLEALTSRFARFADILTQKILRLIELLELETPGTVRDRINKAEKWGIIGKAEIFVLIRELRNSIAHEYSADRIQEIYKQAVFLTPELLTVVKKVDIFCEKYFTDSLNQEKTGISFF